MIRKTFLIITVVVVFLITSVACSVSPDTTYNDLPNYYNVPGAGAVYGVKEYISEKYQTESGKISVTDPPSSPAYGGALYVSVFLGELSDA